MRNKILLFWEDSLEKKGFFFSVLRGFFYLFSLFFRLSVAFWHLMYLYYLLPEKKENCFVVSVGNITTGGSGKTPIIIYLGKELLQKEQEIAILSRGYLSEAERKTPLLACAKKGPLFSWEKIGDEPYMIAKHLPESFLYVGKNRYLSATIAKKKADILLLDDGFQYRKLKKDLQILCINAEDPLGKGYFLPRGFLREHPKMLKKADYIVIQPVFNEKEFSRVKQLLLQWTAAPMIGFQPKIEGIYALDGTKKVFDKSVPIVLFCGIANPKRVVSLLKMEGFTIVDCIFAADHGPFSNKELTQFAAKAKEKSALLLCTEKDAVKLTGSITFPVHYFRYELEPLFGLEYWKMLIEKIYQKSK